MNTFTAAEVVIGIMYATGSILLLVAAYLLYLKKFKRNKLAALGDLEFETAHNNVFKIKTQFLLSISQPEHIKIDLLDEAEVPLKVIFEADLEAGEHMIDFDPTQFSEGKYYLYLKSNNGSIFRKITISRT